MKRAALLALGVVALGSAWAGGRTRVEEPAKLKIGYFHDSRSAGLWRAQMQEYLRIQLVSSKRSDLTWTILPSKLAETRLSDQDEFGRATLADEARLVQEVASGRLDGAALSDEAFRQAVTAGQPILAIAELGVERAPPARGSVLVVSRRAAGARPVEIRELLSGLMESITREHGLPWEERHRRHLFRPQDISAGTAEETLPQYRELPTVRAERFSDVPAAYLDNRFLETLVDQLSGYRGRLWDAMAQWEGRESTPFKYRELGRLAGIERMTLTIPRPPQASEVHRSFNEAQSVHRLMADADFFFPATPKYFPDDEPLEPPRIAQLVHSLVSYGYPTISEIVFRKSPRRDDFLDPLSPEVLDLLLRTAAFHVPIFIHWEFHRFEEDRARFDELFARFPAQIFVLTHLGDGTPAQIAALLETHPNLYATISRRDGLIPQTPSLLDENGQLRSAWREICLRFHDRLLFATHANRDLKWNKYVSTVRHYRKVLAQLPPPAARRIAYENAESLFQRRKAARIKDVRTPAKPTS